MPRPFQLSATDTVEAFSNNFMILLARAITTRRDLINEHHSSLRHLNDLDDWLNNPIFRSVGAGVTIAGFGGSGNYSQSANTSQGFAMGGVEAHLREMMSAIFPTPSSGGFVCVLDNLELLDTSTKARAVLEALRDTVFSFPGVCWVLCGARGIVRTVVSTPRMQGKLAAPIELLPLDQNDVTEVIRVRLEVFKARTDAYTPVDSEGFRRIYQIGNLNLRIALRYCEDFVFWCEETSNRPVTARDKFDLLNVWFGDVTDKVQESMAGVTPRAWRLFDEMADRSDGCSPSDFLDFSFNNAQAMQPHLRTLEQANLIDSTQEDGDRRRKTINLTPLGWMVRYRRDDYKLSTDPDYKRRVSS